MAKRKIKKRKSVKTVKKPRKAEPAQILSKGFFTNNWIYCLIIAALVLGIYAQTVTYKYVLDDRIVIWDNEFTKKGASGVWDLLSTEGFSGYFGEQKDLVPGARYRPLSMVTFALEKELFGMRPISGHIGNVILYILLCVLMYRLCEDLFRRYSSPIPYISFGFCVAVLFTIHPLHTEAIANIKGRDEIMSLLFSLLSLLFILKSMDSRKYIYTGLAAFMFFLGLISKENTITFLAAIPLVCYFFSEHSLKRIATCCLPLVGVTLIYLFIRYQIIGYLLGGGIEIQEIMNNPFVYMNSGEKYATIFYTLGLYLKLGIFPHPLTHDYYPFHIPTLNWADPRALLSLALYLALLIIAIAGLRKKTAISFSILFYFITLSIASNLLFTVGTFMNERFIFASLLGFCIVLTYGLFQWLPKIAGQRAKLISLVLLLVIFIGYSVKSITRVPAWKDTLSLNSAAIKVSKNSARANTFTASALYQEQKNFNNVQDKMRFLDEAHVYSLKAIELLPEYTAANTVRAGVVAEMYLIHRDMSKLLRDFKQVALNKPFLPYLKQYYEYLNGRGVETDQLINHYYDLGYNEFFTRLKNYNAAIQYLNYGFQLDSQSAQFHQAIGQVYQAAGNQNNARFHFQKAAELQ